MNLLGKIAKPIRVNNTPTLEATPALEGMEIDSIPRSVEPRPSPWSIVEDPPSRLAEVHTCDCSTYWEDITGRLHCVDCVEITSRALVRDFWTAWPDGWRSYQPDRWNPFWKLDAEADAREQETLENEAGSF